ncbi:SRPBCC family protein [Yonghaparkia sp. Soil809]|uniref:SRPBCC family protein n=1 Tax=Yonghaparkia sp. Soil809 TaxID=1736417 RepID=UPI000A65E1C8|nr:SRPBCC family protein [Yonghaparkia sp. Soil809]
MSVTVREMHCSPEAVFGVLADAWVFPTWVVGASRMRDVDGAWPEVGSKLHHSFGLWPLVIDDRTEMVEWDPPRRAVMQPAGWPLGEARVEIDVKPRGSGCVVRLVEFAVRGPGRLVPSPVADALLSVRNRETLTRLAHIAEGREDNHEALVSGQEPDDVDEVQDR